MKPVTSSHKPTWMQRPERGHIFWIRLMLKLSIFLGRRGSRLILHIVAFYFFLFSRTSAKASQQYLNRALGRESTWRDGYRHVLTFATVTHDRIFLLRDKFDLFDIRHWGQDALLKDIEQGKKIMLMGAHLGSFDVLRLVGAKNVSKPIVILMHQRNAQKLGTVFSAIKPETMESIIPLQTMTSMLESAECLEQGSVLGILADRGLGKERCASHSFLGEPALFVVSPFRLAALLHCKVYFMAGLYQGNNRYDVHFEPLHDFSETLPSARQEAIAQAQANYVHQVERACRQAPFNWFNFYDFWGAQANRI